MSPSMRLACERLEDRNLPAAVMSLWEPAPPLAPEGNAGGYGPTLNSSQAGLPRLTPGPLVVDLNGDGQLDLVSRDLQGRVLVRPGLGQGRFGVAQLLPVQAELLGIWQEQLVGWDGSEMWQWSSEGVQRINALASCDQGGGVIPLSVQGPDWFAQLHLAEQSLELIRGEQRFELRVGPDANGLLWCPMGLLLSNRLGDVWRIDLEEHGPCWGPLLTALPEVHTGDLDCDDLVDVVYRSLVDQEVWVQLKSGRSYSLDTKTRIGNLTLADLDQDSYLDLVVCDEIGGRVLLYRGQGNGQFVPQWQPGHELSIPAPRFVTAAQLTSGPWLDLIVVSTQLDQVHLLWGQQTSQGYGLVAGPSIEVGPRPTAAVVLDWTGNATPDLLVLSSGSNQLLVLPGLPGQGPGMFDTAHAQQIAVGTSPQQLLVGDFTGNGQWDVLTLNAGSGTMSLIPHGAQTAEAVREIATGVAWPYRAAVGDINRDGYIDLMVEDPWHSSLALLRGDARGWSVVNTLVGSCPNTSGFHASLGSSLWEVNFQSLWPAELTPP
ncbi:MAG: VCBS repeat-containing protein, partial [Gemmataceae bacterium]